MWKRVRPVAYAVHYRLTDAARDADRRLQAALFEELGGPPAAVASVAAYELDAHTRLLLLEVDDVARLEELPALSGYLRGLDSAVEARPAPRVCHPTNSTTPPNRSVAGTRSLATPRCRPRRPPHHRLTTPRLTAEHGSRRCVVEWEVPGEFSRHRRRAGGHARRAA